MAYNYCNEYPERRQQDVGQEITCNQTFENTDGLSIFGRLQQIDNQDKGTGKSRLSVYLDRIYSTNNLFDEQWSFLSDLERFSGNALYQTAGSIVLRLKSWREGWGRSGDGYVNGPSTCIKKEAQIEIQAVAKIQYPIKSQISTANSSPPRL